MPFSYMFVNTLIVYFRLIVHNILLSLPLVYFIYPQNFSIYLLLFKDMVSLCSLAVLELIRQGRPQTHSAGIKDKHHTFGFHDYF